MHPLLHKTPRPHTLKTDHLGSPLNRWLAYRRLGVRDLVRPLSLDGVGAEIFGRPGTRHREGAVVSSLRISNTQSIAGEAYICEAR